MTAGRGYNFGGAKAKHLKRRLHQVQVATDRGYGHRCITHNRTNPYDAVSQGVEHDAWEAGWRRCDRDLRGDER